MMETTNWPELTRTLGSELRNLRGGAPEVMKAFSSLAQAALAQGALDPKTSQTYLKYQRRSAAARSCVG